MKLFPKLAMWMKVCICESVNIHNYIGDKSNLAHHFKIDNLMCVLIHFRNHCGDDSYWEYLYSSMFGTVNLAIYEAITSDEAGSRT